MKVLSRGWKLAYMIAIAMCIEEKATLHPLRVGPLTACVCSSAKQGMEVQSNNTTTTWRDLTRLVGRDLHCNMVNCGGRGEHVTFTTS